MLQTIIIGIDGRPQDAEALALARRLADPGAELIAVNVAAVERGVARATPLSSAAEARQRAEAAIDRFLETRRDIEGLATSGSSVGKGLAAMARGARADLIVLASSRRGLIGRTFAGDSVRDVLGHAPCPVAVAPVGYDATGPIEQVVVGYDGSPEAKLALELAMAVSTRDGGDVQVVEVVEAYAAASTLGAAAGQLVEDEYARARAALDDLAERYALQGRITTGRAAHELARAGRDADLLCVGLHEHGMLDRLMIGSTAHALLREQCAPLLIAPPQVAADAPASHEVSDALDDVAVPAAHRAA